MSADANLSRELISGPAAVLWPYTREQAESGE